MDRSFMQLDLKEMTRPAERLGSTVEFVRDSDVLEVGGVGCLLRFLTPEQHAAANAWHVSPSEPRSGVAR